MRIRLRRSGGFAGLQTPPVEIDSQQLPADKARELEQLMTQARLFEPPAGAGPGAAPSQPAPPQPVAATPGPARDGFQYDLTVEDGGCSQAVRLHEGAMHPDAARLVQWLAQEGRGAPGRK
ncbi:MAG TPA: protealysin inhibitor emfourin [Thermoanaerobaculia bacterium]|nr:protealysin inhibitor emfourin [Thermoanaerobaculia bacterium]